MQSTEYRPLATTSALRGAPTVRNCVSYRASLRSEGKVRNEHPERHCPRDRNRGSVQRGVSPLGRISNLARSCTLENVARQIQWQSDFNVAICDRRPLGGLVQTGRRVLLPSQTRTRCGTRRKLVHKRKR